MPRKLVRIKSTGYSMLTYQKRLEALWEEGHKMLKDNRCEPEAMMTILYHVREAIETAKHEIAEYRRHEQR